MSEIACGVIKQRKNRKVETFTFKQHPQLGLHLYGACPEFATIVVETTPDTLNNKAENEPVSRHG